MTIAQIDSYLAQFGMIPTETYTCSFSQWSSIQRRAGIYTVWNDTVCMYAGQSGARGGIHSRFPHHWRKATGTAGTGGTRDTAAWQAARSTDWDPAQWRVEYRLVTSAVDRTLLEGIMIKILQPVCNDEVYIDRLAAGL